MLSHPRQILPIRQASTVTHQLLVGYDLLDGHARIRSEAMIRFHRVLLRTSHLPHHLRNLAIL